jgi:hypothetical protein
MVASRWARTLTTEEPNPLLDLDAYVGQRASTFRFEIVDAITGYRQTIHPLSDSVPVLTHDTDRTIKRQISGVMLGVEDTQKINSLTSRLELSMIFDGVSFAYPLGRYMPNNQLRAKSTSGTQSNQSFYDESFIVDQEITSSFGSLSSAEQIKMTISRFLSRYPISYAIEYSPYAGTFSWQMGTRGGYVLEQLALDGDWFSPWMDNANVMRFIRVFDPATAIPTFDLDVGNKVLRNTIVESDDLITAPNRFIVVSNGTSSVGSESVAVVGMFDVPASAPHSIANRGFVIPQTENRQLESIGQANAVARAIGQQSTAFETLLLDTAPDPRHDSYDVLRWQGSNWLELSWTLPLTEGAAMHHVARKAYGD